MLIGNLTEPQWCYLLISTITSSEGRPNTATHSGGLEMLSDRRNVWVITAAPRTQKCLRGIRLNGKGYGGAFM
jgi:hypothetical protein